MNLFRSGISVVSLISLLLWSIVPIPLQAISVASSSTPLGQAVSKPPTPSPLPLGGDCGPKVLQKILAQMGRELSLEELIHQTKTVRGQTSLEGLAQGARLQGLWSVGVKTDTETLSRLFRFTLHDSRSTHLIAHVGGNQHYVWIQEVSDKWVKGYNPALRNPDWKMPRKVFEKTWQGEGLVVWRPSLIDLARAGEGFVIPFGFESNIVPLTRARTCKIVGGNSCGNCSGDGGSSENTGTDGKDSDSSDQHNGQESEQSKNSRGDPVDLSNGNLSQVIEDLKIPALGPDLIIERTYNTQLFSELEGWEPHSGTGSWAIEDGTYAGSGDRSGTTQTWENFTLTLTMQTIDPGDNPEYDYEVAWVNFRYVDADNRYYFLIRTTGVLELAKYKDGVFYYKLVEVASSHSPTDLHQIQVSANGANIQIYVDGTLQIDYTDPDPVTGSGSVALESYFSHSQYDDITVNDLGTGETTSWDFTEEDQDGMFSRGWRSNLEMNLILKDSGDIVVRRGNDARSTFSWDEATSAWTSPIGVHETLEATGSGYGLTQKDGTVYSFNSEGELQSIEDRHGNTLTLTYTEIAGKNRISQITHSDGRSLTLSYDTNAHCTGISDPLGRTLGYSYNADNLLESATDPKGNTRNYQYDTQGRLTQYTDRNGNIYQYSYLYNNRVDTQTDPEGNVTTFDYEWDTTQVTDSAGNIWTYQFEYIDGRSYLINETDPEGNLTSYDWDEEGNLLSKTDPNGNITQYSYDASGNMLTKIDPDENTETWTYESTYHQIETYTDKRGNTTNYTYDSQGNLTQLQDPLSYTITASYNTQGQMTSVTDKRSNTATFAYDSYGYLDTVTDPQGNTTDYEFDAGGRQTQMTNALGHATPYEYDENGNLVSVTDPEGHLTSLAYDANDNRTTITDALGYVTTIAYNAYNKPSFITDPLGRITSFSYDKSRYMLTGKIELTQIEDPQGGITSFTRDKIGRITQKEDALGNVTTYAYDSNSNLMSITDANSQPTSFEYDSLNRLSTTTYADSSTENHRYDENGNLLEKTLRSGSSISFEYNSRNELTQRRLNDGLYLDSTTQALDSTPENFTLQTNMKTTEPGTDAWNVAWIKFRYQDDNNYYYFLLKTDGIAELTRYQGGTQTNLIQQGTSHSPEDLHQIQIQANGAQIQISMDGEELINTIDSDPLTGSGQIILEGYNSSAYFDSVSVQDLDAGTSGTYYDDITLDEYTYDENGNLTQITRGSSTWTLEYDSLNRITQTLDSDSRTVQYGYDAIGRRTSMTYPDGMELVYTWTDDNLLYQITEGGRAQVTYSYDDAHRRTLRRYNNGVRATYSYDDANQLTSLVNAIRATTLSSFSYTYDDLGNRTQQVDNIGTHTYAYDAVSELTQALYATGTQQDYQYDGVHNRTQFQTTTPSASTTTYSINSLNQITESIKGPNTTTYNWDANGNLSQKVDPTSTTTFTHNSLNQLTEWTKTGRNDVSFEYDPLGRRITKTQGATVYQYTWDGAQLIEVRNSAGTVQRKFVYGAGIDEPVYMKRNSARYFYTQDGLGSISELTSASGSKIEYYTYDVYGKPTLYNSAGTQITSSRYSNPFYFTGREYDFETALYYYRARYYDPILGRFLETDPLGYFDSLNLYSYVGNNPWNWVDPFGLNQEQNGTSVPTSWPADALDWVSLLMTSSGLPMMFSGNPVLTAIGIGLFGVGTVIGLLNFAQDLNQSDNAAQDAATQYSTTFYDELDQMDRESEEIRNRLNN